jgi:exopolyphosphatase / guanosine-5'-triphosphate,3'-diphosphate pyrophosphatase
MKLAVIDCGTNTFNLLILDIAADGKYERIFHTRVPVKMGGRSIHNDIISDDAFKRGIDAIREFHGYIKDFAVENVMAYATSAIRDAKNGPDFTGQVHRDYGIDITVIDGETEAELIYKGVRQAVKLGRERVLIMDIGGGSTEFIIADGSRIYWKQSFNLGAARLLEKFDPSDPVTPEEVESIFQYLEEQLQPLFEAVKKFRPDGFVGSSGAFESLIEMIHEQMQGEPFSGKTEYIISVGNYERISRVIRESTIAQRQKMKGLVPMRVDMIVIFCLKVDFILNKYKFDPIRVSAFSLKEGAAIDYIETKRKR